MKNKKALQAFLAKSLPLSRSILEVGIGNMASRLGPLLASIHDARRNAWNSGVL